MAYRIELPETRPEDDYQALVKLQSDLLDWAEELFGERDKRWTILPPKFENGHPHTFYVDHDTFDLILVKLGDKARDKWTYVLYQLAHEVIHLLNPRRGCKANSLEEGVASAFSYYVQRRCGIAEPCFVRHGHRAYEHVHNLLNQLPGGDIAAAKRIRKEIPAGSSFSSVMRVSLERIFPEIDGELAAALASKFDRDRTDYQ